MHTREILIEMCEYSSFTMSKWKKKQTFSIAVRNVVNPVGLVFMPSRFALVAAAVYTPLRNELNDTRREE